MTSRELCVTTLETAVWQTSFWSAYCLIHAVEFGPQQEVTSGGSRPSDKMGGGGGGGGVGGGGWGGGLVIQTLR